MAKVTVTRKEEVEVTHLLAECSVRYWEDATVNGVEGDEDCKIPGRVGDMWVIRIEISTGKITCWEQGVTADVHFKVCDEGVYSLIGDDGVAASKDGYVPSVLCPKENGYGDYVIMSIDENGFIDGWDDNPDLSYFEGEDE